MVTTYQQGYSRLVKQLGSPLEARELFLLATGIKIHQLPQRGEDPMPMEEEKKLSELCRQRLEGHPLQYILGEWEFYGLPFFVGEGVLIPRQDTETLVDTAIELMGDRQSAEVLDVCAGSGAIAIAIQQNSSAKITAVELSENALEYLNRNISLNHSGVEVVSGDGLSYRHGTPLYMVVSNPPYIPTDQLAGLQKEVRREPKMALDGGEDGLDFYRQLTRNYYAQLEAGGYIIFEVGINQDEQVEEILTAEGFIETGRRNDLSGITRVVWGKK